MVAPDRMDGLRWALVALTVLTVSRIHQHFGILASTRPALFLAGVALAFALMKPSALSRLPWSRMWPARALLALGIWACLSTPFGLSFGASARMLLDSFSKVLIFAFLVMATIRGVQDLRRYMWAYVVSVGLLVWMSLFVFGLQKGWDDGFARLSDLYTYDSNDVGVVLLSGLGILLLVFQTTTTRNKLMVGLLLLGLGATIARSGSRGGFLGSVAAFATLVLLTRSVSLGKRLAFTGVAVVGLAIASPPGYWKQMQTVINPKDDYNWTEPSGRRQLWKRGMGYMQTYPVFGVGLGQFPRAEGTLSSIALEWDPRERGVRWAAAHNSFVQAGAELGFPGLVIWSSLALGGFVSVLRLRRRVPLAWARGDRDEQFLYHATSYLPVSFAGFAVSAFFVSFAWSDALYFLIAMLVGLHVCVRQRLAHPSAVAAVPVARVRGGLT